MTSPEHFEQHKTDAIAAMQEADLAIFQEGVWSGSMGGHDPDFGKLKGGLANWWRKKAASDPHPFAYCVRHLSKRTANPERLCAWIKDQALGTTKWRKGAVKEGLLEAWTPTIAELKLATEAFQEAEREARGGSKAGAVQEAEGGAQGEVVKIEFGEEGQRVYFYTDGTTEER